MFTLYSLNIRFVVIDWSILTHAAQNKVNLGATFTNTVQMCLQFGAPCDP